MERPSMALHHDLPIYQLAYNLLSLATDLTKNLPRDIKVGLGRAVSDECVKLLVLIARANAAQDKAPHLVELIESNDVIGFLLRVFSDKHFISKKQHADAMEIIVSIGKSANGWKKSCRRTA